MDPQRQLRLNQIVCIGVKLEAETEVPPQALVAVWSVESEWGAKPVGKNNFFGIKKAARHEICCTVTTREWFTEAEIAAWNHAHSANPARKTGKVNGDKSEVLLDDQFADYESVESACDDFAWLISHGDPYRAAWQKYTADRNVMGLIAGIAHTYSTSPAYTSLAQTIAGEAPVVQAIASARSANKAVTE